MSPQDDEAAAITKCPWCGASGPDFDESPCPQDFCGHDPALMANVNAGSLITQCTWRLLPGDRTTGGFNA